MVTKKEILKWLEQFDDNTELATEVLLFANFKEGTYSIDLDSGWVEKDGGSETKQPLTRKEVVLPPDF